MGMTYVMSDIHGHYEWFKQMLELIQFQEEDKLYIIGDVIDKGEDSASLFIEVVGDNRITCLLGNHEKMLLNALKYSDDESTWFMNDGENTIRQFEEIGLNYKETKKYIEKFPVEMFITVGDKRYCLVHGKPLWLEEYPLLKDKDIIYQTDIDDAAVEMAVWSRALSYDNFVILETEYLDQYIREDTTLIIGHTPTVYCHYDNVDKLISKIYKNDRLINVDCGCAGDYRLGCLRLDDMQEFYIPEKDEELIP